MEYPIGKLYEEAEIATARINGQLATTATLFQMAIASIMSKEGGKAFREVVEDLNDS